MGVWGLEAPAGFGAEPHAYWQVRTFADWYKSTKSPERTHQAATERSRCP